MNELVWTREKPTPENIGDTFWYRHFNVKPPQCVRVFACHRGELWFGLFGQEHSVALAKGEWAGPIPLPREAT